MPDTESLWEDLLELIEKGKVVPVIGSGLLSVSTPEGRISYYAYLASRLAEALGISPAGLPAGSELNEVACRYIAKGGLMRPRKLYTELRRLALEEEERLPIPDPITQLASIPSFRLFVTTTFSSFIDRALRQMPARGSAGLEPLSYSPEKFDDLSGPLEGNKSPIVYHLLGKSEVAQDFAVTHEDILEFVHSLQSQERHPRKLFDEVEEHSLLILGCLFNDWLARFFLRAWRTTRLSFRRNHPIFVADSEVAHDSKLVQFLNSFSSETWVFEVKSADDFVAELYRRWKQRRPETPAPATQEIRPAERSPLGPFVFISYAREDRDAALQISKALQSAGIDTFLDLEDLEPGVHWQPEIRKKIRSCSLFLALISRNVFSKRDRYVNVEWNFAFRASEYYLANEVFLFPVAIDGTVPEDPGIPEEFQPLHWYRLPNGYPDAAFVDKVRELHRRAQQERPGIA